MNKNISYLNFLSAYSLSMCLSVGVKFLSDASFNKNVGTGGINSCLSNSICIASLSIRIILVKWIIVLNLFSAVLFILETEIGLTETRLFL